MVFIMLVLILVFAFLIYKYLISSNYITNNEYNIDFFDDISKVLDKYNIEYYIEKDTDNNKMMVIVRNNTDPFFAVTKHE